MSFESVELPSPVGDEVVVEVEACGMNFADALCCRGQYQDQPDLPFTPGIEVAGQVVDGGPEAGFDVGTAVVGAPSAPYGGYARRCIASSRDLVARNTDAVSAAGGHVAFHTAWFGLKHRARLAAGEWVMINAAAGGTGSAGLQMARHMGARTIAVAGGGAKADLCRELGAEECVDYKREDLRERVMEITGGKGVEVVYDPVGGKVAEQSFRCCGFEGRFVIVGFASGTVPHFAANHVMVKNIDMVGIQWPAYRRERPGLIRRAQEEIDLLVNTGALSPLLDRPRALSEAADALDDLLAGRTSGKVVLVP